MERFTPATAQQMLQQHLEKHASVPGATVVLDIDDTVLRTEGRTVLPHPLGLHVHRTAQRLGIPLVYITARRDNLMARMWAMQQLHMLGVGTYAELRMMPHGTTDVRAYKAAQRQELVQQGRCLILNMGDQWTDFAAIPHPASNAHYGWTEPPALLHLKLPHDGP